MQTSDRFSSSMFHALMFNIRNGITQLCHVGMVVWEVVLQDVISCSIWNSAESEWRLDRRWVGESLIFDSAEVGIFLPRDHKCS